MLLGITGCPGSGKTLFSEAVAGRGWKLINADDIGRHVVEEDDSILKELADEFGSDIIDSDGTLNRRLLASRAFSNPERTSILNGIVHPRLVERLKEMIGAMRSAGENVVVDCALIFEWRIEKMFDLIVCVAADEPLRKKRLMDRDGRSESDVEGMFSAQKPEEEKAAQSDIVIHNNGASERIKVLGALFGDVSHYWQ